MTVAAGADPAEPGLIFASFVRDGDPRPYVHRVSGRRTNLHYEPDEASLLDYDRAPRLERSRNQVHEGNPVLDEVRVDVMSRYAGDLTKWFADSIWPEVPFAYAAEHPAHKDHAKLVLARLQRTAAVSAAGVERAGHSGLRH